jgi:dolichol-phosphate mannosyltransferase
MAHDRPVDETQALVIVPTYNEFESIAEVARRLFDAAGDTVDLLVVDDGSPDGTAELVKQMTESSHGVHLMERAGKQGLGTAYVDGFRWALERPYWAVVEMDADLSHDPADVPRMLETLKDADLVIGSRYVPGGQVRNWSKVRRALSAAGNLYARMWLGYDVRDSTSGFRAYRREVLEQASLSELHSEGYSFQIELTRRVARAGGKIVEIPITFVERVQGKSKMSKRIVIEAMGRVTQWGFHDRFGKGPKEPDLDG